MKETADLTIGTLARAAGTKVVTVRYYEKIGLLPAPARTAGNYRRYGAEDLRRLRFIRRCRELGFTIGQLRTVLDLSSEGERECDEVDRTVRTHLAAVEAKICDLNRLADELRRIGESCTGGRVADCRIIEALSP